MSEVIVVTSGKGGVGKTTTSANVGTGLAELGKSVVLIDADIGLRNLDVVKLQVKTGTDKGQKTFRAVSDAGGTDKG